MRSSRSKRAAAHSSAALHLGEVFGLAACLGSVAVAGQIVADGLADAGAAGLAQLALKLWLHPHTEHSTNLLYRLLDNAVQVVSFSEARESFKAVLDRVEADADVTLITRRHAKGAVVMSLDTYNSLMETVHLLRSPANAAHLQRSLEQAGRGELLSHGLIDPDLADGGD